MPALNRTALIVEDQPFVGLVASDILKETGFETFHASDASAAMALLRSHPEIDVLLAEADLSGQGEGVELIHAVARERPEIQIVVASEKDINGSDVPHGARVLRKPFSSAELRAMVAPITLLQDA